MQQATHLAAGQRLISIPLEDFGVLQARYNSLPLSKRAQTVLDDARPALEAAEHILHILETYPQTAQAFERLRNNHALVGKMRATEARQALCDSSHDFVQLTRHKLSAWRRTMQRVAEGEGIAVNASSKEYIIGSEPIAIAIAAISSMSHYLAIVQLAIGELVKMDNTHPSQWPSSLAEMRRCATVLSDYEHASSLNTQVH